MNGFSYGTPALLFPAISLLMLAYTNRFLALASLSRSLGDRQREQPNPRYLAQLRRLQGRITLLRHTQAQGVLSLSACIASMFFLFLNAISAAQLCFAIALLLMLTSLLISLLEIHQSERALQLELKDLEISS